VTDDRATDGAEWTNGLRKNRANVRNGCVPCKGGVFQWVRVPPSKSALLRPNVSNGSEVPV